LVAGFQPTGNFSLTGMMVTAEDTVNVTFRLTRNTTCPTNTSPALQPTVRVLRRNCDGSVRRGAASPTNLDVTRAVCEGNGVFKASVTAPFIRGDLCFGIAVLLADGTSRLAILKYD
jgi:hypothetical protein